MINKMNLPSRGKCRYLWTIGNYSGIASNYESVPIYRKLFISGIRKLDLDAIYLTSLIHLNRQEEILKAKKIISNLAEIELLPKYLELNKFVIDSKLIQPQGQMTKAYEALIALKEKCISIESFWRDVCANKTISIIGNAPITSHLGNLIDQSDIVLRFNNFQIKNFELFVGRKTSAWCRICDIRPPFDQEHLFNQIKTNIFTDNPLNIPVGMKFIDEILNENKNFYFIPQEIVTDLAKQLNAIPSSGIRLLISLSKLRTQYNIRTNIFGFSFSSKKFNHKIFDHYFETKPESKERAHNITSEVMLLRNTYPELTARQDQ